MWLRPLRWRLLTQSNVLPPLHLWKPSFIKWVTDQYVVDWLCRWLSGKESACNVGDRFHPWVGKIPWRWDWQPTPVFLPGKSHGHRSLAGYSPWGCKAFDTTERLSVHAHTHTLFTVESRLPFSVKWQSRHSEKSCWKQNTQKWLIIDRKHLLKSIANKICNQLFKVKIIIMYCGVYK